MENNSLKFYKESGIAPVPNLLFSFLLSSSIITLVSYYYSLLVTYMPFIYINFLMTMVFGYIIALVSYNFFTLFKIRSRKKLILFSILLAVVGIYAQWASYIYIISIEGVDLFPDLAFFTELFIRPDYLINDIGVISENGAWEIFGIMFKGAALWLIWTFEIAIIVSTTYYGVSNKGIMPFSEASNEWYKKHTIETDFEAIKLRKDFVKSYSENPVNAIKSLDKGNGFRYSKVHIYKSKTDRKSLVSIENVMVTESGRGKKETEEIIAPHFLENNYVNELMQEYRTKKVTFFDSISEIYS